ncbi:MAG: hypothetical protein R3F60_32570, partial [bacterium]
AAGPTADEVVACGTADCQAFTGWAQPASVEAYCAAYVACDPSAAEACPDETLADQPLPRLLDYAFPYAGGLLYGPPVQACVLAALSQGGACPADLRSLGCPGPGRTLLAPGGAVQRWDLSPGGRVAVFQQLRAGQTELGWGRLDGSPPDQVIGLRGTSVVSAAATDAGDVVVVLFDGSGQILLVAPRDGEPAYQPLEGPAVERVALAPSGRVAALLDASAELHLWNISESQEILRIRGVAWPVAFSPTEGVVGLHFTEGVAELWDVVGVARLGELAGAGGAPAAALAFSPSGETVVTASAQAVQIWEAATQIRVGQEAVDPRYLQGAFGASWSADGASVVVAIPTRLSDPTTEPLYRIYGIQP